MRCFAPAKVNLALHVTGRRADGYHLLDSLVVFAGVGDTLDLTRTDVSELRVTGRFAEGVPTGPGNLIWKAHVLVPDAPQLQIVLEKNLPHAAGIGGGSSDAAAILRALEGHFDCAMPEMHDVLSLGADVPVCLSSKPQRMRGIGETLDPAPTLPPLSLVLVNPRVSIPTGPVFKALSTVNGDGLSAMTWGTGSDALTQFIDWLAANRNDLEAAARQIAPEINDVLTILSRSEGCLLARMSGSGATCFGVFDGRDMDATKTAADRIAAQHPDWWVKAVPVLETDPTASR